ncbi:MAG: hypothetical protein UEP57_05925 [Oscillospiraceae bacterium]|nr:hypothetical protein [Oscillospiraceae bacterium]
MNKKLVFALWGGLFILCAALGFIPDPEGALGILMTGLSLAFFAPPAALLYRAVKEGDSAVLKLVRNLSALWLALTLVLLIVNFLSAFGSEVLGNILYYVLIIVTSPMICSGHWAMSMFCWACLLMVSLRELRKSK